MPVNKDFYTLAGSSGQSTGYEIGQSIRFNDDDTAYMSKTISSTSSRTTWTFSTWFKLGNSGINNSFNGLFSAVWNSQNYVNIAISNSEGYGIDFLLYGSGSTLGRLNTTRLLRDPSAFYHLVAVLDTTNDVSSERMRLYINGVRETSFTTESYPSKDSTPIVNYATTTHNLGRVYNAGTYSGYYYDGYMAEIHFLDGYAYGPEYFGEFKEDTDVWIPKEYTGSYGTNGFYIKGSNSGALGTDSSGNGNNLTVSGLASNDQKTDTPTNNKITFNPLNNQRSGGTPSNGNLDYTGPSTRTLISLTANIPKTGKWAVAFKATNNSNDEWNMGITKATNSNFGDAAGSNEAVGASDGIQFLPSSNDAQLYDYLASATIDPSLPITTSDEFWMAVDTATGKCFLGIYDASSTSMKFVAADSGLDGNPATGDNPTITISDMIGSGDYTFAVNSKNSNVWTLLRSTDVSGTTPTGYTYFENVKDLL